MGSICTLVLGFLSLILIQHSCCVNHVAPQEWEDYKNLYDKEYPTTGITEPLAQYYYAYNKRLIENHNALYARGQRTYKLKINQFTDMRLIHFNALFPLAPQPSQSFASTLPEVMPATDSYDPIKSLGFMFNVEDQGIKCTSGWAYAAVKAIEILQATQSGNVNPLSLSAQNIIDCAGGSRACRNQVPQIAYDYLTQFNMDLLSTSEYPNNNTESEPGMCLPRGFLPVNLAQYSRIANDDDERLRAYVSAGYPVVVEFNPTSFEFMHYSEGVFQPPPTRSQGSHFMVVIGYDRDTATGMDYWILQNSFDTTWGETGLMRIRRASTFKLAKNAIMPTMMG